MFALVPYDICQYHVEFSYACCFALQQSSGIFHHLKDCVLSHVQGEPTPDLHPDTLNALGAFMLAQAQDCFCRKAISGTYRVIRILQNQQSTVSVKRYSQTILCLFSFFAAFLCCLRLCPAGGTIKMDIWNYRVTPMYMTRVFSGGSSHSFIVSFSFSNSFFTWHICP